MQVMGVFQKNLVYQTEKPGNFYLEKYSGVRGSLSQI